MQATFPGPPRPDHGVFPATCNHLYRSQPALALFALAMLVAMVPTLFALALDPRMVHGVATWAKPLKFMASTALFAATMAWAIGLLPEAVRRSRTTRTLAWLVIATASFEVGYISLQAALGVPSHYNDSNAFHAAMFSLMALAAVVLVATQAVLAWQLMRHVQPRTVFVQAVAIGLAFTFLLSTASGFLLGALRPPAGAGLAVAGWHLGGGDLRPAHFVAVHAQQLLPLAGLAIQRLPVARAASALRVVTAAYLAGWGGLLLLGLQRPS